jgi:hypothetical protein
MPTQTGYDLRCTLTYGDIYGQIMIWLLLTFLSLATAAALSAAGHPIAGLAVISLIIALTLPFLLFTFITTLISHLAVDPQTHSPQALPQPETL